MGASEGPVVGHQMRNAALAGRPVGPPRGGNCYLDNIEISQAKRETLLLVCPFLRKVLKKETGPSIIRVRYYT